MVRAFRYVLNENLLEAFSQSMPLESGKKVFRIICPDISEMYFEVIETGVRNMPYQFKSSKYFYPFSQTIIEWFSDNKLLWG